MLYLHPHISKLLEQEIILAPPNTSFLAIFSNTNNPSILFPQYYNKLQDIIKTKGLELLSPSRFTNELILLWNLKTKQLLFADFVKLNSSSHHYYNLHKPYPKDPYDPILDYPKYNIYPENYE